MLLIRECLFLPRPPAEALGLRGLCQGFADKTDHLLIAGGGVLAALVFERFEGAREVGDLGLETLDGFYQGLSLLGDRLGNDQA